MRKIEWIGLVVGENTHLVVSDTENFAVKHETGLDFLLISPHHARFRRLEARFGGARFDAAPCALAEPGLGRRQSQVARTKRKGFRT